MKYLVSLLLLACGACGAPAPQTGATRASAVVPADVAAFAERRDGCDHFRNEDPYDAARAEEIRRRTAQLCSGTDRELARLKRAYASDAVVIDILGRYEVGIE